MASERFTCYWLGYLDGDTYSLQDIPDYVDYVNLFLINIDPKNFVNHTYITSQNFTWDEIMEGCRFLQGRGQKVIASLMSEPDFNFNQIADPTVFANYVAKIVVGDWGLDGINIDPEMSKNDKPIAPNANFIEFVAGLRTALGSDKILSYVSYRLYLDDGMLKANVDKLDWVSLMGYFWQVSGYKGEWNKYRRYVPAEQLLIGVKPGVTEIDTVKTLCAWQKDQGGGGMMLFRINSDPKLTYSRPIHACLTS